MSTSRTSQEFEDSSNPASPEPASPEPASGDAPSSKDSRIDLRLTAEQKALLERAASLTGVSLSAYTLLHLLPQAQKDIENFEKLTLSNRDRDLFLSTIANPPKLKGKLKQAISNYQNKYGKR